jgi:hypothetical protein
MALMKIGKLERTINQMVLKDALNGVHGETHFWDDNSRELRVYLTRMAAERLGRVIEFQTKSKTDLYNRVLNLYESPGRSYKRLSNVQKASAAHDAIAQDLLVELLIGRNGDPTEVAMEYDWIVDPRNYAVSKRPWKFLSGWLQSQIDQKLSKEGRVVEFEMGADANDRDLLVAITSSYLREFGMPSIIAVPNTIDFTAECVVFYPTSPDFFPDDKYPLGLLFFPLQTVERNLEVVGELPEVL